MPSNIQFKSNGSLGKLSTTEVGGVHTLNVNVVSGGSGGGGGGSTGGLTNAELRATPVPVSGTVAITGGLTDAQLRATPIPVSGSLSSSGLTDEELRASPLNMSLSELNATMKMMLNTLSLLVLSQNPFTGQLRVSVDAGTLPAVNTLSNVTNIGGFASAGYIQDNMLTTWAESIRPRIT